MVRNTIYASSAVMRFTCWWAGRVTLGACIVGPHAGELIAEYGLAIAKGMKAGDLSGTIHVYPTLADINRRVAEQRLKEMLTPGRKLWLKRIFGWRA